VIRTHGDTHLLLIGADAVLKVAAQMARDNGATVSIADDIDAALAILRQTSVGLAMIDVAADVAGFIAHLRTEGFAVPVIACGIDVQAEQAVAAIRAGARDYVSLPPDHALIAAILANAAAPPPATLVGNDPSFVRAVGYAWSIAPSRIALSIVGEPKTGRTMLARSIHAVSGRGGRFLIVDAAHGTPTAIEAELFGRAAGESLPPRRGKLDEARGGTLFLREVDRLPLETQGRLAHALASGHADTRIIASAHADLAASAAAGTVRADLAARLGTVRIALPPLRDRVGDIPALAAHFAEQAARIEQIAVRPIADAALALLARHTWPCNIQELEDVVHRATVLARGSVVGPDDLVLADGTRLARTTDEATPGVDRLVGHTVEDVERALILKTLERCRGNRTSASGILGISVRTMRNKLKSFVEAGIAIIPAT
jgi:DNA-binding NtrC family response regulator